jgi:hypothetical protein
MIEPLHEIGKVIILFGIILVLIGGLLLVAGKIPFIGRLPGDIIIERKNFTFYFPLGTSILLSIVLSIVLWLLGRGR